MKFQKLFTSIADSSENFPERVAVVTDEGECSYKQLWELVNKTEKVLETLNLPHNHAIAVTAHKSIATITLMLALGRRGHTPLPISPDLGDSVKPVIFKNAGVYCELNSLLNNDLPTVSMSLKSSQKVNVVSIKCSPLMLTTSGTTGIPKVVCLSHEGVNAFFNWASSFFNIGSEFRVLSYAPLNFDLSLLEVWTPLMRSGTIILTNPSKATQGNYLQSLIRETKPQLIQGVPMFFGLLSESIKAENKITFKTEHIIFTGDVTPLYLRKKVKNIFPESYFHNIYGCTETNDSFIHTSLASNVIKYDRLPLGSPIQGTTYRIVDDYGVIVTDVGEGELHTSTPFLAHGYTESEKSDLAFYWDDLEKRRYYKTGDRASIDKYRTLNLLGRSDYIVKVRGVRTNIQDVEQIISLSKQVSEAVVIPINDELSGVALHAVIKLKESKKFDGLALRTLCAEHLPLTSVPRRFHIHEVPMPRTSTGKLDRQKIAQFIKTKEI